MDVQEYPKQIEVNGVPVVVNDRDEERETKKLDRHKPEPQHHPGPVEMGRSDGTVDVVKADDDDKRGGTRPAADQVKAARDNKK